jgi:hypothetical protein
LLGLGASRCYVCPSAPDGGSILFGVSPKLNLFQ